MSHWVCFEMICETRCLARTPSSWNISEMVKHYKHLLIFDHKSSSERLFLSNKPSSLNLQSGVLLPVSVNLLWNNRLSSVHGELFVDVQMSQWESTDAQLTPLWSSFYSCFIWWICTKAWREMISAGIWLVVTLQDSVNRRAKRWPFLKSFHHYTSKQTLKFIVIHQRSVSIKNFQFLYQ